MNRRTFLTRTGLGVATIGALGLPVRVLLAGDNDDASVDPKWRLTPAQWRKRLTPEQYRVLRQGGTEPSGSSPLNDEHRAGIYHCSGCELPLYSSKTKFHSGTGWPSFYEPLPHAVSTRTDHSWFMSRTEVHCARCHGHLGHVFDDGPPPTGLRYCMNGVALHFVPGRTEPAA